MFFNHALQEFPSRLSAVTVDGGWKEMTHFTSLSSSVVKMSFMETEALLLAIIIPILPPNTNHSLLSLRLDPFQADIYLFFYTELKPQTLLSNCLPLKLLLSRCLFVLGFTCYVTKIISHIWVFGSLMRYTPNHTGAHQHSNARHSPDTGAHFLGAICKKLQEFAGCSSITA